MDHLAGQKTVLEAVSQLIQVTVKWVKDLKRSIRCSSNCNAYNTFYFTASSHTLYGDSTSPLFPPPPPSCNSYIQILVMNVPYCQTPDRGETRVSGASSAKAILLIHIPDASLASTMLVTLFFSCNIYHCNWHLLWNYFSCGKVKVRYD